MRASPVVAVVLLSLFLGATTAYSLSSPTTLDVVETGDGWARLRWDVVPDGDVAGYRVKTSHVSGSYPSMTDWNGYEAAFSFGSDDGFIDNMVWASVFERHGKGFTIFAIPDRIDEPGYLTTANIGSLHYRGHEIASHSYSHKVLLRNTAFTINYVGTAPVCSLHIEYDFLWTTLQGDSVGLAFDLTDPSVEYIDELVDSIDADPDYECVLEYYPCRGDYCWSLYVEEVFTADLAIAPYTALTKMGCDSVELVDEVVDSKAYFENAIADTNYVCRTLAYPRHAHDQREMNAVMEAGYLGARNGPISGEPPGIVPAPGSFLDRVHTYQTPVTWGKTVNDSSEAYCRQFIQGRIAEWKANGQWAIFMAHTLADWDSAHVDWAIDEIVADGGVWVAPFGEIAEHVRAYQVTVDNPVEGWNDSLTVAAPIHGLPAGNWIYAVVVAFDSAGVESGQSNEVSFRVDGISTAAPDPSGEIPSPFSLEAPRPNPMNPSVTIPFEIDRSGRVAMRIYDSRGRLVRVLLDDELPAGRSEAVWKGRNGSGTPVPSGIYLCTMETAWGSRTEKIILIR